MRVTLYEHTANPAQVIGFHAAECYDSDTSPEKCVARAKHCQSVSHLATLRFAYATFGVEGISRVCSHQIVRVAHAGILQRSQRYVAETSVTYIDPPALKMCEPSDQLQWRRVQEAAEQLYLRLIETKQMKKEDARYILPQGCSTSLRLCLNFQGWIDLLKNRTAKKAQWEVRAVAEEIQRQLHGIAPELFDVPAA